MVRQIQIDLILCSDGGRNHICRNRLCSLSQLLMLLLNLSSKLILLILSSLLLPEFIFGLLLQLLCIVSCPALLFFFLISHHFLSFSFLAHFVLSLSCGVCFLFCTTSLLLLIGTLQLVLTLLLLSLS